MRILFAISILALVALLWASVATAQHIRRVRREHRRQRRLHAAHSEDTGAAAPPLPDAAPQLVGHLSASADNTVPSPDGRPYRHPGETTQTSDQPRSAA